jgi:hypothetical protein
MIAFRERRAEDAAPDVVTHVRESVLETCGGLLADGETAEEVARAVQAFLDQHGVSLVESRHLVVLASRALSAIGSPAAGRRLLVLGAGMVRPSVWEVTGRDSVWALDLRQATLRAEVPLEIALFASLGAVLESFCDVWDPTSGEGVLGLRHLCATAAVLAGKPGKKSRAAAREIVAACEARLRRIGETRRWKRVPEVMNMDL